MWIDYTDSGRKIICRLTLKLDSLKSPDWVSIDWAWKDSFAAFFEEAFRLHPGVVYISMDWGGDDLSLMQGDLHCGTWEKHDGKWQQVKYADSFEYHYENKPLTTLVPYPELDEIEQKVRTEVTNGN